MSHFSSPTLADIKAEPFVLELLNFPREVRDMIYSCILISDGPITIGMDDKYDANESFNSSPPDISILTTCKQVAAEGTRILYGKNTFRVYVDRPHYDPGFLKRLPQSSLKIIPSITFASDYWPDMELSATGTELASKPLFQAEWREVLAREVIMRDGIQDLVKQIDVIVTSLQGDPAQASVTRVLERVYVEQTRVFRSIDFNS